MTGLIFYRDLFILPYEGGYACLYFGASIDSRGFFDLICFASLALERAYDEAIGTSPKLRVDYDHEVVLEDRICGM